MNIDGLLDFHDSMSDEDKLRNQLLFFQKVLPSIYYRLTALERETESLKDDLHRMQENSSKDRQDLNHYKYKIKRIEKFLIDQGLIKLMENIKRD